MYTIQALWTAARHNINVKFVVCNNGSYRLLQLNIDQFWREQGIEKHDFPLSFDLSHPPLKFAELAQRDERSGGPRREAVGHRGRPFSRRWPPRVRS